MARVIAAGAAYVGDPVGERRVLAFVVGPPPPALVASYPSCCTGMRTKTLRDIPSSELDGRRCLVRVDFNVPLDPSGKVADDTRIVGALPTLQYLSDSGARTVLLSHLGRPKGGADPEFSLRRVAERLGEISGLAVGFCPETVGTAAETAVLALTPGGLLVLENTRFLEGETADDPTLSEELAKFGDLFVQDAFGTAHRAHASTVGVVRAILRRGGDAVAGFLMERELRFLRDALEHPRRPFVAVLGGAKISGKIDVVEALLPRVDRLLIGGAMANTFLRALGYETGNSLVEEDRVPMARDLAERAGDQLMLPVDFRVAPELTDAAEPRIVARDAIPAGERIGDIGPGTVALFSEELAAAGTVVWNGPMGVFESPPFAVGTLAVAESTAAAADAGAIVVIGGGDSASAVVDAGVADRITHISTGGGAALELLAGEKLPGVEVLSTVDGESGGGP